MNINTAQAHTPQYKSVVITYKQDGKQYSKSLPFERAYCRMNGKQPAPTGMLIDALCLAVGTKQILILDIKWV